MPHINYSRGETRTFVVRRQNWPTARKKRWRGHHSRKGLRQRLNQFIKTGPGGWYCRCCGPKPGDPTLTRLVRRREKRAWLRDIAR